MPTYLYFLDTVKTPPLPSATVKACNRLLHSKVYATHPHFCTILLFSSS